MLENKTKDNRLSQRQKTAFKFIILMGVVSLLGDVVYEGARSITAPYLYLLGASALIVSVVAGAGEFVGYALRLLTGYLSDKTKSYWAITIVGYGLICSIPLLAFAGNWQTACLLIIIERLGKAIRSPARDVILSNVTSQVGRGLGFGIHEAMDQVGAIIGPLFFSLILIMNAGYREGFWFLWIPAILCVVVLLFARKMVPAPEVYETADKHNNESVHLKIIPSVFRLYILFTILTVSSFVNFPLIAYHAKAHSIISDIQIPLFYVVAMGVDALVAILVGRIYDRVGLTTLAIIPVLSIMVPCFAFSNNSNFILVSAVLWGAVMGIHETVMRAAIADMAPIQKRGFVYGIFNTAYGFSFFIAGVVLGVIYTFGVFSIFLYAALLQIASFLVLLRLRSRLTFDK